MSELSACLPLSSGSRLMGFLQDGPIPVPVGERKKKYASRSQLFHILFERVETDNGSSGSINNGTNNYAGYMSSSSNACSSTVIPNSDQIPAAESAAGASRSGWLVQGIITFEQSELVKANEEDIPLSTRFTGTADPITGAFNIVTEGAAGVHCDLMPCRYIARQSRLGTETLHSGDSIPGEACEGSLFLGLWSAAAGRLSLAMNGAFFICRRPQKEDPINASLPSWARPGFAPIPRSADATISLPDRVSLPYSSLWYFGVVEYMGALYPMTFLADARPSVNEEDCYTVEGHLVANGRCTPKGGFQFQVRRPKAFVVVKLVQTAIPIEGEWRARCELDVADDSHAFMSLSNFSAAHRPGLDFEHAALNGWTTAEFPRQMISATLLQSHAQHGVQPATRFHLYSVSRRLPRYYDEDMRSEGPRDETGRAHGYEHRCGEAQGDVSVVYEYNHGMIMAAKMYSRVHTYQFQTYKDQFPLRFMPTSSPGVLISVRGEKEDRNHLEMTPTIKPRGQVKISGADPANLPQLTAGVWHFCGLSNDYGDCDGVLMPQERPLDLRVPQEAALHFKPAFTLPSEHISSCTGELWIGKWHPQGPIGEHQIRTSDGQWWLLTFLQPGRNLVAWKAPVAQNEEILVSARNSITAWQQRLRDHRLKADEQLRQFNARANDSLQFQTLKTAPMSMAAVCRSMDLPATRHIISAGDTEVTFDTCLFRSDEPALSHLRDVPHGFGIMFDSTAGDSEMDTRAGLPRGTPLYEGEFQLGQMHGFGHNINPSLWRGSFVHVLGQFQFGVAAGNAAWIYYANQAPIRAATDTLSMVAKSASKAQLQQLVVTPGEKRTKGCPGYLVNFMQPYSSSIGRVALDKTYKYTPNGISLQRFSSFAQLALWDYSVEKSQKHGPFFQLDYITQIPIQGTNMTGFQVEMLSGPPGARLNHGRVHSTHPLLMQMCAAVEHQATELDDMLLTWMQATARFEEKRCRFQQMPITGPVVQCTVDACLRCGAPLSIGNYWRCHHGLCPTRLCSRCKGSSSWGCAIRGHDASHGTLHPFQQADWKQAMEMNSRGQLKCRVNPASAVQILRICAMFHFPKSVLQTRIFSTLMLSKERPLSKKCKSMPKTLDLSFDGQREATLLAPTLQGILAEYGLLSQSRPSGLSGISSDFEVAPFATSVVPPVVAPRSSSNVVNSMRESLLTVEERKEADAMNSSSSSMPMSSYSSSGVSALQWHDSSRMPTMSTILDQLNHLLRQCSDVISTRDALAIDRATPTLFPDGTPVHMGSDWHRSLGSKSFPIDAPLVQSHVRDERARETFKLLLLSRVRSVYPFLQWIRNRCATTVNGGAGDQSQQADSSVTPLRLDNTAIVTLMVLLQHYGQLVRLVKEEVLNTAKSTSSVTNWIRRAAVALLGNEANHLNEDATTSTLPALQLWIRLLDTKDLIVACIPLLQDHDSTLDIR